MSSRPPFGDRRLNLLSVLGFCSLAAGLLVAHVHPATRYELSIYSATPVGFWVGVAVAFLVSLVLAFWVGSRQYRLAGIFLGGLASTAVVALPIIRGYAFQGIHDSITHVGWTRALLEGSAMPTEVLYPAIHTVAAFVGGLAGTTPWRAMLFVPLFVILAFFVFVPLVVRDVIDDELATAIGAFSAFLLVPTHMLATTTHAHPSSQAILFTPVVLFLLVRFLRAPASGPHGLLTSVGVALLLVVAATVLYHPQQALNVLVLLGTMSLVQFVAGRTGVPALPRHRRLYSLTAVAALVWGVWLLQSPTVFPVLRDAVASLLEFPFGSPSAGASVGARASAVRALGESLPVVLLKMFLVSAVYVVLTGVVLVVALGDRFRQGEVRVDTTTVIRYLGVGLLALFPVLFVYFLGIPGGLYFRIVGFMLMMGTILGAVALVYARSRVTGGRLGRVAGPTLSVSFGVMILLSMLLVHGSPYLHHANQHVTEARIEGYETTFATTGESAIVSGIRQDPQRYYEALVAMEDNGRRDGNINSSEIDDLAGLKDRSWYLMLHSNTYQRELRAYEGYRYTEADLAGVQRQAGVDRIHSNGDTELYYVP